MSKISKKMTAFIFFLTLVILLGLVMKISIDTVRQTQEPKAGGLSIQFENGTTEPEVKAILENCNIAMNYTVDYNSTTGRGMYYLKIDRDKIVDLINELRKDDNLSAEIKKGNYSILMFSEEFVPDKNFLITLEKNNLQIKKSIFCYIHLADGTDYWVKEKDAIEIKDKLETNEKVLAVGHDYLKY